MSHGFHIPVFDHFQETLDFSKHMKVPSDWFVFVADVKNSTDAIQNGRYKQVNLVGASCIIGVINAARANDIPFIFGGDGATFLVPPHLKELTETTLVETSEMSEKNFGLTLRTGFVPVSQLYEYGYSLGIAKLRLSEKLTQTVISGNGLMGADGIIKNVVFRKHTISSKTQQRKSEHSANYEGLECRWQPLKNTRGEMASLIVRCMLTDPIQIQKCYLEIMHFIDELYGNNPNPIEYERLRLSTQFKDFETEGKIVYFGKKNFSQLVRVASNFILTQLTKRVLKHFLKAKVQTYLNELSTCSDFRKFDGVLRMVLDSSPDQTKRLENYLNSCHLAGKLAYGIHRSENALLTCMIFERQASNHMHLVDGSDGGYALAALQMKRQIKDWQSKVKVA